MRWGVHPPDLRTRECPECGGLGPKTNLPAPPPHFQAPVLMRRCPPPPRNPWLDMLCPPPPPPPPPPPRRRRRRPPTAAMGNRRVCTTVYRGAQHMQRKAELKKKEIFSVAGRGGWSGRRGGGR